MACTLEPVAPGLWHLQHDFAANGLRISSRMTVVRIQGTSLWRHSPVPLSAPVRAQLAALEKVAYIVAPNKMHHVFVRR